MLYQWCSVYLFPGGGGEGRTGYKTLELHWARREQPLVKPFKAFTIEKSFEEILRETQ